MLWILAQLIYVGNHSSWMWTLTQSLVTSVTTTDYCYREESYYYWRTEASAVYSSSSCLFCFEGLFFLEKKAAVCIWCFLIVCVGFCVCLCSSVSTKHCILNCFSCPKFRLGHLVTMVFQIVWLNCISYSMLIQCKGMLPWIPYELNWKITGRKWTNF